MPDNLSMKEKWESTKLTVIVAIVFTVMVGTFIWAGFATVAIVDDLYSDNVVHTGCEVTNKISHSGRQVSYRIDSTCGNWFTDATVYNHLKIGNTYDLETTEGNWAHKPSLRGIASSPTGE